MRSSRAALFMVMVVMVGSTLALTNAAAGADLQRFSGTWAYTAAHCRNYLHDRIGNEARKRGAGLMIVRPAAIEWVTPASCEITSQRGAGDRREMDGKCEIKGRDFSARLMLIAKGADHISLRTDAREFGRETRHYVRCSSATEWRAN